MLSASSQVPHPTADHRGAFALVWLACASACLTLGVLTTFVPRYIVGPLGGGGLAVGLTAAAFAVGACLVRPFAGALSDVRGRRVVLQAGAVTMAIAAGVHLLPLGITGMAIGRVLLGLGQGAVFTAGAAWAVDLAPEDRRGRLLGLFGLTIWLGLALGPLAAEVAYAIGGYDAVWLLAAAGPLVGAALTRVLPDGRGPDRGDRPAAPSTSPSDLLPAGARRPGLAIALASVGHAALGSFVVLMLEDRGIDHATLVFTAFAAGVVGARLVLGGLPDRIGPERCATGCAAVEAVGLAVLALAPTLGAAIAGALLVGVGFSVLYPSLALIVVRDVPEERRGAALGTYTGCYDVGVGLASPIIGLVAGAAGYGGGFVLAAVCAVAAAATAGIRVPLRSLRPAFGS